MPVPVRSKTLGFARWAALALTVFFFHAAAWADDSAQVQTYGDAQPPSGVPWNSPLQAGQMTLKDVLEAHPKQKQPPSSQVSASAPLLAPTSKASSENVMLMQGMQNVLQEPGTGNAAPRLKAPKMQSGIAPALQPASNSVMATAPATPQYQPGQAPKDLGTTGTSASDNGEVPKATDIEQAPPPLDETQAASTASSESATTSAAPESSSPPEGGEANFAAAMHGNMSPRQPKSRMAQPAAAPSESAPPPSPQTASAGTSNCNPHVETWSKTCAQAGYPESYVGKITGETRTVCPAGDLQDVWMENSCTPSGDSANAAPSVPSTAPAAAPASAPAVAAVPQVSTDTNTISSIRPMAAVTPPPRPRGVAPPSDEDEPEVAAAVAAPVSSPAPTPAAPPRATQVSAVEASAPAPAMASATVNANCGAANGLAANAAPMADLCAAGMPSSVSGDGPWRWDCSGSNGGITVSCAAPVSSISPSAASSSASGIVQTSASVPEDGKCGSSNGAGVMEAPGDNLCAKGVASRVNGGGPWTWACSGSNGGQAAACMAQKKIDGACGVAGTAGGSIMPTSGLCTSGFASAVTGNGPWNWTCSGLYGGTAATCAAEPKRDAVCGNASLKGHHETPSDNLCAVGSASEVMGQGPWSWNCGGMNNGASVTCNAAVSVSGACGSANGVGVAKAPLDELCSAGKASRVSGAGPWTWNCGGTDGGDTQSCTAPVAKAETEASAVSCGVAANTSPSQAPSDNLCASGTASAIGGEGIGPWRWSCSDDSGHSVVCMTSSSVAGLCGTAANVPIGAKPGENLCAAGKSGKVSLQNGNWVWICGGAEGGSAVSCSSPHIKAAAATAAPNGAAASPASAVTETITSSAICGASAGRGALSTPSKDLCDVGKATIVKGKGPWHWTCIKGKDKTACEAPRQIDARCGSANGSIQKTAPEHGLCVTGSPTDVAGNGPWLWSCVGAGGGASASCSASSQAQTRVDGSCGVASNAATEKPAVNLCDSGNPSNVYGDGPWTWTCSGINGGIASSCTARKTIPQGPAPPGPAVNGLCGAANGVAAGSQPAEGLCSAGTVTGVVGQGPWNWNCLGSNSGMTVSCTAPLMPPAPVTGACGAINGIPTLTTPQSGLCSAGISSAVSGKGPWTWSCSGTNGGGAVGCVAPLATSGGGGLPSLVTPVNSPPVAPDDVDLTSPGSPPAADAIVSNEAPTPKASPSAPVKSVLVTPKLPSGPLPPLQTGSMPPSGANFGARPQGSTAPFASASSISPPLTAPQAAPEFPQDNTAPLEPPPVRDTIKPSPALKPPVIDADGAVIPGNRFNLPDDVASLPFNHGSENIGNEEVPALDKLAGILQNHGGVRVTLTAYAALDANSSPREARRLSLARALAVRDYLTNKSISSARIDVRALGANVPSGDADRVDVKAN